jgi:broad specificity phosphatase PhoE
MKVYFVRHGETPYNRDRIHQTATTPLSDLGMQQARAVAKRFGGIEVDVLLVSDYTRARQTAEAIGVHLHAPVETSELLREKKGPTELEDRPYTDPVSVRIRAELASHAGQEWHYSDEENFFDFRDRVSRFVTQLESRSEQRILVVTHEWVIEMVILLLMFGGNVTPDMYRDLNGFMRMTNTGITVCERDSGKWRMVTWNDHSHLP